MVSTGTLYRVRKDHQKCYQNAYMIIRVSRKISRLGDLHDEEIATAGTVGRLHIVIHEIIRNVGVIIGRYKR